MTRGVGFSPRGASAPQSGKYTPECYHDELSGSGLRAMGGCKPRQVRKEATVAV